MIFFQFLIDICDRSNKVISVCTGACLLANAGILNGKNATSNKAAWYSFVLLFEGVNWIDDQRFVEDGKYLTTSGISAGIDGCLYYLSTLIGINNTHRVAKRMEYHWVKESNESFLPSDFLL